MVVESPNKPVSDLERIEVEFRKSISHLAGIRVCANLVENYALQAYWTRGDEVYEQVRQTLSTCVDRLIELAPDASPRPLGARSRVEPGSSEAEPGSDVCPSGTHPVDSMCIPD